MIYEANRLEDRNSLSNSTYVTVTFLRSLSWPTHAVAERVSPTWIFSKIRQVLRISSMSPRLSRVMAAGDFDHVAVGVGGEPGQIAGVVTELARSSTFLQSIIIA
jgi:hypothetical protein